MPILYQLYVPKVLNTVLYSYSFFLTLQETTFINYFQLLLGSNGHHTASHCFSSVQNASLRSFRHCENDEDSASSGSNGVVVRAFGLYWAVAGSNHYWSLSKSFIPSFVVWSMTKNNTFGGERQNKKRNGEHSDLCDLEQVTLKPHLQGHH